MKTKMVATKNDLVLENCPACKGGAVIWEKPGTVTDGKTKWLVKCGKCELASTDVDAMHAAVKLWNTRTGININSWKEFDTTKLKKKKR